MQFVEGLAAGEEEGATEYIGLEDVMLIPTEERRKQKHRSRSRSGSRDSPSRLEQRWRRHSRSRSPPAIQHNQEDLEKLVKERERAKAATSRKEDVAKRPASYKSSLSLQLPVGTTRSQKDRRRDG